MHLNKDAFGIAFRHCLGPLEVGGDASKKANVWRKLIYISCFRDIPF